MWENRKKISRFLPVFLFIFISLLSPLYTHLRFAPFSFPLFALFYRFVKECEIKLLKECESSKLRSGVARLTTNDPFLLAPPLHLLPSPPHTRESSDTFVMEERGSKEEFSLVSSSISLVPTLLTEQYYISVFQYKDTSCDFTFFIRENLYFHPRAWTIRGEGKINRRWDKNFYSWG